MAGMQNARCKSYLTRSGHHLFKEILAAASWAAAQAERKAPGGICAEASEISGSALVESLSPLHLGQHLLVFRLIRRHGHSPSHMLQGNDPVAQVIICHGA